MISVYKRDSDANSNALSQDTAFNGIKASTDKRVKSPAKTNSVFAGDLNLSDSTASRIEQKRNSVLSDAEKSDEFVIKCSPQDYSYISENQGKIFCNMSKDITLDITTDETLGKNDCIIETDGAVFDCSLDKELVNLTKKIKMLSCLD